MASEATSVGKIGLDLVVNQGQFNRQLSGIKNVAAKAGKTIAAAFAVKKLADFGKSCISLGSDLQEVQNVVDVTFSSMSKKVDKFAQNAAEKFGLSETAAKKYVGTFGAMAKSFGFNEKAAYNMSTALAGLSGDIASFYNISQDEAFTKLKSVFTGETETLKELGVVMTQNALDAYAMANGYGKTTKSMSEAEKVALRYAFVQERLTAASGDFSRTSGSWANQVRILTLQFESLKATIGQGLINVFTPVIRVVNVLIGRLLTLANAFKTFTGYFSGGWTSKTEKSAKNTSKSVKAVSKSMNTAVGASKKMGAAGEKAVKKVEKAAEKASNKVRSLMGFDQINKVSDDAEKASGGSSGGSSGAGAGGIDVGSFGAEDFSSGMQEDTGEIKKLPKLYENIAKSIEKFKKACSGIGEVIKSGLSWAYENVLKPLGKWTISEAAPRLLDVFSGAIRVLTEVMKVLSPIAKSFWDNFLKPIAKFTGGVIVKFLELLALALNKLADFIKKHRKSFTGFAKTFSVIKGPANVAIGAFKKIVKAGVLVYKNWDTIKKKLSPLANYIKKVWNNIKKQFVKTIKNILDAVEDIKNIPKEIKKVFKDKIEGVEEWFSGIKDGFVETCNNLKDSVPDMSEIKEKILEKIGQLGEMTLEFGAKIVTSLKDLISGFVGKTIEFVAKIGTTLKDLIKNFTGKAIEFIAKLSSWKDDLSNKIISFKAKLSSWKDDLSNKIISFKAKISSFSNSIKSKVLSGFKAKITSFTNAISTGKRVLGGFKAKITSWIDNVKSKFTKKKDGGIYKNGRWNKIQQYASGGKPANGQMFIAREAGPELVGTIGGHSSVMNNDQIVASVSSGVARAVSSAMAKVGQGIYNAISGLKIESKIPQIQYSAIPKIVPQKTSESFENDKIGKMIELLYTNVSDQKATNELLKTLIRVISNIDFDVKLDGKSIKDDVVRRINNNTLASGKCEINI